MAAHGYRFRRPLSFNGMIKLSRSLVSHWGTLGPELQLWAFSLSGLTKWNWVGPAVLLNEFIHGGHRH
jgi:hypothetical protein